MHANRNMLTYTQWKEQEDKLSPYRCVCSEKCSVTPGALVLLWAWTLAFTVSRDVLRDWFLSSSLKIFWCRSVFKCTSCHIRIMTLLMLCLSSKVCFIYMKLIASFFDQWGVAFDGLYPESVTLRLCSWVYFLMATCCCTNTHIKIHIDYCQSVVTDAGSYFWRWGTWTCWHQLPRRCWPYTGRSHCHPPAHVWSEANRCSAAGYESRCSEGWAETGGHPRLVQVGREKTKEERGREIVWKHFK